MPTPDYSAASPLTDYTASSSLSLQEDPAYLAYINAAGLSNKEAVNQYNQSAAGLQAALQSSLALQQLNNPVAMQQNAGGYEARGISRSGEALKGQAQLAAQQQQIANDTIANTASGIGSASQDLANKIAQNNQGSAQAGIDAADRLARQRAAAQQQPWNANVTP
jgi:hypothetical protein